MDERATGIILRCRPLTESSLITHWLTADLGRIATVAKGARRPKSAFRGKLDLYFSASFSFRRSRRSELHNLREVKLIDTRSQLRTDLVWLKQAAYASRLVELASEVEAPIPGVFDLFSNFLARIQMAEASPVPVMAFELCFLTEIGLQPDPSQSGLSSACRGVLEKLLAINWKAPGGRRLRHEEFRAVDRFLARFIHDHLGRIPKGRPEALTSD